MFRLHKRTEPRLQNGDILSCKRRGRIAFTKSHVGCFIHVVRKYQDDAEMLHNCGLGREIYDNIWINPDLTKMERDAKYQIHKQRKVEKLNKKVHSPTKPEMIVQPMTFRHRCLGMKHLSAWTFRHQR